MLTLAAVDMSAVGASLVNLKTLAIVIALSMTQKKISKVLNEPKLTLFDERDRSRQAADHPSRGRRAARPRTTLFTFSDS